eukprot:TRINITY_DN44150_c0_g1_i1.p1 TRINITY_DN44150_c0_g1~~TRINITY_DN44150_c0_g1_i1.p1  ORF type:complete len:270 (-),score=50.50 TRINITY_DN44150_c0_g1_i1:552-1361(-)
MHRFALFLTFLVGAVFKRAVGTFVVTNAPAANAPNQTDGRVSVDFFWMAKCPDSQRCAGQYMPMLHRLASFVNLRVSHLVDLTDGGKPACLHGEKECIGSRQQLCAQKALQNNTSALLEFLTCHAKDVKAIPGNTEACGKTVGLSKDQLDCSEGEALLVESIHRADRTDVDASCTVLVQNAEYCKDEKGVPWPTCSDSCESTACLKAAVCSLIEVESQSSECQGTNPDETEAEDYGDNMVGPPVPCVLPTGSPANVNEGDSADDGGSDG